MAVEQLSSLVPVEVRNETERDPLSKLVDRRQHGTEVPNEQLRYARASE